MTLPVPVGVGLGLRSAFLRDVDRGEAEGRVAFFEVAPENYMHRGGRLPKRLESIAGRHPLLTHGLMMSLGSTDALDRAYLRTLKEFLHRYAAPWHSDHLCFSGLDGTLLHDLLPVPFDRGTARRIADRISFVEDALGVPMAIENISWYVELGNPHYAETDFINEILALSGCRLLLDVNNVFVNASNHGFDPFAWLAEIPLDRVVALHVAGHEPWDDTLIIDTHGADVRREVEEMLHWVIARCGPRPVVLERDAHIPPLPELLAEVDRIAAVYANALCRWNETHAPH